MVDEYNVQPYNDGRTEKTTESLLTLLDYHNFFGNIRGDKHKIIGQ